MARTRSFNSDYLHYGGRAADGGPTSPFSVTGEEIYNSLTEYLNQSEWSWTVDQILAQAISEPDTLSEFLEVIVEEIENNGNISANAINETSLRVFVTPEQKAMIEANITTAAQIEELLDVYYSGDTWRTQLTGAEIESLLDTRYSGTAWRTQLTAAQIESLLDTYYGNTDWRDSGGGGGDMSGPEIQAVLDAYFANDIWRTHLTAAEIENLLDTYYGNTQWRMTQSTIESLISAAIAAVDADDIAPTASRIWYTTTQQSKLTGIESGATADQTASEIETLLDAYYGGSDWRTPGAGAGFGSAKVYDTIADLEADTIGAVTPVVYCLGYRTPGDTGDGQPIPLLKVAAAPSDHDEYYTTVDSYIYELNTRAPTPTMTGAYGDMVKYAGIATIASAASVVLTTTAPIFSATDIGKRLLVRGASAHHELHRTYIDDYNSTTSIDMADAGNFITSGTGYTGYSVTDTDIIVGHDDTESFIRCWNYARAKKCAMYLDRQFLVSRADEFGDLDTAALISLSENQGNVAIIGAGRQTSGIFYALPNRYNPLMPAFFNGTGDATEPTFSVLMKDWLYEGCWQFRQDEVPHSQTYPAGTAPTFTEQLPGGQFSVGNGIFDFTLEGMGFANVIGQITWIRSCYRYTVINCYVDRVAGGGFIATNTDYIFISNNRMFFITDDAVMVAGRFSPTNTGVTGDRAFGPFQCMVNNNMFFGCGMVKINHSNTTTVADNTFRFCKRGGCWIRISEDVTVRAGSTSIAVTGNVITDLMDVGEISQVEGSLGHCLLINAVSTAGAGTYIPGDGDSTLYDKLSTWVNNTDADTPVGPAIHTLISGNLMSRTIDELLNYSDLDFKQYDMLARATASIPSKEDYEMDIAPVSDAVLRPHGIWMRGPRLRNTKITNNIIAGLGTSMYFGSYAASPMPPSLYSEMEITGNSMWDVERGVQFQLAGANMINAMFRNNRWDIDPLRIRAGRHATNGTWTTVSDCYCINDILGASTFRPGITFIGDIFANCSAITNGNTDTDRYNFIDCWVEAGISTHGFSTSNEGVGRIPDGSSAFRTIDMILDPGNANFLTVDGKQPTVSATPPTAGNWVRGTIVDVPGAITGGGVSVLHHKRVTTSGAGANAVGTDWHSIVGLIATGNYLQLPGKNRQIANNIAVSFAVPDGLPLFVTSEGNPSLCGLLMIEHGVAPVVLLGGSGYGTNTTGVLTGTTGGTAAVIFSMDGGTLYTQNRTGTKDFQFIFLGGKTGITGI